MTQRHWVMNTSLHVLPVIGPAALKLAREITFHAAPRTIDRDDQCVRFGIECIAGYDLYGQYSALEIKPPHRGTKHIARFVVTAQGSSIVTGVSSACSLLYR